MLFDLLHVPLEPRFIYGLNYINKTSNKDSQNELRNILNKRGFISGKNLDNVFTASHHDPTAPHVARYRRNHLSITRSRCLNG